MTRVTIIGEHRHLDLRLPSDDALSGLLPQIRGLMFEGSARSSKLALPSVLTSGMGEALDDALTLRESDIADGSMLYLRGVGAVPPAPDVYDVPSFTAAATDRIPGLWSGARRSAALSAMAGILLAGSGAAALQQSAVPQFWTGGVLATGLILAGALLGRFWFVAPGSAVLAAGWAIGIPTALAAGSWSAGGALMLLATVLALVGSAIGTRHHIPFLTSAALLTALGATWAMVQWATADAPLAAGVTGILSVLALGVAPRLATTIAGLNGLDDDQRQGKRLTQGRTLDAVHSAHQTLIGWAVASAAATSVAAVVVASAQDRGVWALPTAVVLLAATLLRGQSLPILAQRVGVYTAVAGGTIGLAAAVSEHSGQPAALLATAAIAVLVLLASGVTLREQTAARLRVMASRAELMCVLATIPLVLGLSGAYSQLGRTFG